MVNAAFFPPVLQAAHQVRFAAVVHHRNAKGTSRVVWFRASMVAQVAVGRLNTGMTTLRTGPVLQTGPVGAAAAAKTSIEMPSYAPTW